MLNLKSLEQAVKMTQQILEKANDDNFMSSIDDIARYAVRSGVIQHFEFTYELCWKYIKRWIKENRTPEDAGNPVSRKELFRIAAQNNLIKDPQKWFRYGEARNMTSHTYNKKISDEVYNVAGSFIKDAGYLLNQLEKSND